MPESRGEPTSNGILIAAALALAAVYILTGRHNHYTVTFTRDMLPKLLQDNLPSDAEGILITATLISKDIDSDVIYSDKASAGIMMNKMINYFGRHDTKENK